METGLGCSVATVASSLSEISSFKMNDGFCDRKTKIHQKIRADIG